MEKGPTLIWPRDPADLPSFAHTVCKAIEEHGIVGCVVPSLTQDDVFIGQADVLREFGLSPRQLHKLRRTVSGPATPR